MAIALVQSVLCGNATHNFTNTGGTLSCTGSFPSATGVGNLLVAAVFGQTTGQTPSMGFTLTTPGISVWTFSGGFGNSDTTGGQWKGNGGFAFVGNAPSIAGGTVTTCQCTFGVTALSYTGNIEFMLFEFSGVLQGTFPTQIQDNAAQSAGSNSTPDGGLMATTATDLILSAFIGETRNLSAGSGYTLAQTTSLVQFAQVQYQLNAPAGNIATAWSGGTEVKWGTQAQALLPPATPPAPTKAILTGGPFEDSLGRPVANGYLVMIPTADAVISQNGFTFQIYSGVSQRIPLNNAAFIAAQQSVWGTDIMTPSGTKYYVMLYRADGTTAWSKWQTQSVTGSSFNVSSWIPN